MFLHLMELMLRVLLHYIRSITSARTSDSFRFLTETPTIVQMGLESAPPMTELGESTCETDLVGIVTEEL